MLPDRMQNRYKEPATGGTVNSVLWVSPPFIGRSSSICSLPLVRGRVKVWKVVLGLVTVDFTFSPEFGPTSEGSKKKSYVVTVISLTSDPGDGEVVVGVAV